MAKQSYFIIAYTHPATKDVNYYYKREGMKVMLTTCKLSARRYKTFKGASHALIDLVDFLGSDTWYWHVVDISDLVDWL